MLMFMLLQLNLAAFDINIDVTPIKDSVDYQYHRWLQREYELTRKKDRIEIDLDHLGKQIDALQRCRDEQQYMLKETCNQLRTIRQKMI